MERCVDIHQTKQSILDKTFLLPSHSSLTAHEKIFKKTIIVKNRLSKYKYNSQKMICN